MIKKVSFHTMFFSTILFFSPGAPELFAFQNIEGSRQFSPKTYVIHKISDPLTINGKLDKTAWQQIEWILRELYDRQRDFRSKNGDYAEDLDQLQPQELFDEHNIQPEIQIRILDNSYIMSLTTTDLDHIFYIREDSRSWKE